VALGRVRTFIKKYGAVGVTTYFTIYGVTLASLYGAFSGGLLFPGDVVGLIEYFHLGGLFDESLLSPKLGSFALAWVVAKFTEPLRFGLTLAITPSLSRWWSGKRGDDAVRDDEGDHADAAAAAAAAAAGGGEMDIATRGKEEQK